MNKRTIAEQRQQLREILAQMTPVFILYFDDDDDYDVHVVIDTPTGDLVLNIDFGTAFKTSSHPDETS